MTSARRTVASVLFLLLGAVSASAQAAEKKPVSIPFNDVVRIAPTVRTIIASPKTLTVHVGQTVSLDAITVTVVDSMGHLLGRLEGYDFVIPPGQAASAMPRKITGVHAGETTLTVKYPRSAWAAQRDPRVQTTVKVVVTP